MTELSDLEARLGHRFSDPRLLEQALTHGSVRHEHQTALQSAHQQTGQLGGQEKWDAARSLPTVADNERLEFLGDAIVGMIVAELLYRRYPELDEGELTRLRAALVSRRHLGQVGLALNLGEYLLLGRAEERNGGRRKAVLLANCMEALIGALYLEGGLSAAAAFVERTVADPYIYELRSDLRERRAIGDYKTALQELLQARRAGPPEYTTLGESGPDHRKRFLVEVQASIGKARGEGSNKKRAEQEAARALHEQLTGLKAQRGQAEQPSGEASPASEPAPDESHWPDLSMIFTANGEQAAPADHLGEGDRLAALASGTGVETGSAKTASSANEFGTASNGTGTATGPGFGNGIENEPGPFPKTPPPGKRVL